MKQVVLGRTSQTCGPCDVYDLPAYLLFPVALSLPAQLHAKTVAVLCPRDTDAFYRFSNNTNEIRSSIFPKRAQSQTLLLQPSGSFSIFTEKTEGAKSCSFPSGRVNVKLTISFKWHIWSIVLFDAGIPAVIFLPCGPSRLFKVRNTPSQAPVHPRLLARGKKAGPRPGVSPSSRVVLLSTPIT